tara:strand:- start:1367 stop:1603 length:237 start_codon:yes stop_codon:yes gene_type:complete
MTSIDEVIRLLEAAKGSTSKKEKATSRKKTAKRKPTAYQKRYSKAFKKHQSKHKTKAGKWKKDGFKKCQKAAHKEAKR